MAPITPDDAAILARELVALYAEAETELLYKLARHLEKGVDSDHWTERQLREIQKYRIEAEGVLAKLQTKTPGLAEDAGVRAFNRGAAIAQGDVAKMAQPALTATAGMTAVDTYGATAMAAELTGRLGSTRPQIFRAVDDIYGRVIRDVTGNALLGATTRREAASTALKRLVRHGITGYTDRAGKRWELTSYVEAATRTALMNAAIEGHTMRLQQYGQDLVVVSDVPQECEKCRPFEGKVLSLSGGIQGAQLVDGYTVNVLTSLDVARGEGLFHPNCRHSYGLYVPGATRSFGETADPDGSKAREKLRYLERQLRAAKREQLTAMTPEGTAKAKTRVRAYQSKIREQVSTTTAKRQPHREQLTQAR